MVALEHDLGLGPAALPGARISLGLTSDVQSNAILADAPALIVGIVTSLLGAWSLYDRVRTTKKLTGVSDSEAGPQPY